MKYVKKKEESYVLNEKEYIIKKDSSLVIKFYIDNKGIIYVDGDALKNKKSIVKKINNEISNYTCLIFSFEFANVTTKLKVIDKVICLLKYIEKKVKLNNKTVYFFLSSEYFNYVKFIECSVELFNIVKKSERIEKIYDRTCEYLDDVVIKNNICEFKDDRCLVKRNTNCLIGCCQHFKHWKIGMLFETKLYVCEYQRNKSCATKCLSCKMFMCDEVQKKGYRFTVNNVLTIKRYFNVIQKIISITTFYTSREKFLKKLNRASL